jgi:hypothetical protein
MPRLVDGEPTKPVQPVPVPSAQLSERVVPLSTAPSLTEIHPDQVESVVRLFEDSARDLTSLIRSGVRHMQMLPMGKDDVSKQAAEGFDKAAFDGPASYMGALQAYRDWLRDIAEGIRVSAARYRQADADNTARFGG